MRYKLTPQAQADLDDLTAYGIEQFGEGQAIKYLEGLEYSFELLCENPYMGTRFDEKRQHVVYYTPTLNYILIVEVRHGSRLAPEG
ncbi:MAG: type II toxin-antitoxin system RelE/ParE family toxin [Pseudomonadota bacterium]